MKINNMECTIIGIDSSDLDDIVSGVAAYLEALSENNLKLFVTEDSLAIISADDEGPNPIVVAEIDGAVAQGVIDEARAIYEDDRGISRLELYEDNVQ
jgi:hypothetical protein